MCEPVAKLHHSLVIASPQTIISFIPHSKMSLDWQAVLNNNKSAVTFSSTTRHWQLGPCFPSLFGIVEPCPPSFPILVLRME
jgi:hypothetical protein